MRVLIASLVGFVAAATFSAHAQNAWSVDKGHSNVKFSVAHLVVSDVEGAFKSFNGTVKAKDDTFSDMQVDFTVDVNSVNTEDENRDKHLKSDDFFNAEKFPQMKFVGKSWKKEGNAYKLSGDLTIRDVTKPVTFDVKFGGVTKDPWGNTKAGFKAQTVVNRFDYNLKWSKGIESGGLVVGKDVTIALNVELTKAK